jgi:hypothetical protein
MSTFPKGRQKLKKGSDSDATGPQLSICRLSGTQVIAGDANENISSEWHIAALAWSIIRMIFPSIGI